MTLTPRKGTELSKPEPVVYTILHHTDGTYCIWEWPISEIKPSGRYYATLDEATKALLGIRERTGAKIGMDVAEIRKIDAQLKWGQKS